MQQSFNFNCFWVNFATQNQPKIAPQANFYRIWSKLPVERLRGSSVNRNSNGGSFAPHDPPGYASVIYMHMGA